MHLEYGHLEYAQEVSGCTGSRSAYRSIVDCIYTAHIHILIAFFTNRIHKENKQVLPYQPTLLKTLTNIIYWMCLFQHVGKQDRTHVRTNMVKIALLKLVAGILCGCVVLLVLVAKWVMKKNIQTYPYSNCAFRHRNSQRVQTSFTVPTNLIENFRPHNLLHVSLSALKTGQNPCKNKHGENCIAQVVCWHFVRLCGAAGVGGEVSDEKNNPNTSIFELHFPPPEFTKKTNKFYRTSQPYWKLWPT